MAAALIAAQTSDTIAVQGRALPLLIGRKLSPTARPSKRERQLGNHHLTLMGQTINVLDGTVGRHTRRETHRRVVEEMCRLGHQVDDLIEDSVSHDRRAI